MEHDYQVMLSNVSSLLLRSASSGLTFVAEVAGPGFTDRKVCKYGRQTCSPKAGGGSDHLNRFRSLTTLRAMSKIVPRLSVDYSGDGSRQLSQLILWPGLVWQLLDWSYTF